MIPDPVGLSIGGIALVICYLVPRAAISVAFACLAFSSTAVAALPALGGAPVTVPQFGLLLFVCIGLRRRGSIARMNRAIFEDSATQALLIFTIIAIAGAVLLPRLMAWQTKVYALARYAADLTLMVRLVPSSGNVTQSLYLLGSVGAFFAVIMAVRNERDVASFVAGFKILIVLQAAFACIDGIGKYGFGIDALAFLRTADYDMLTDGDLGGLWRISGTESEASFLATALAGQWAFCLALWRSGQGGRFAASMLSVLTAIIILSTSSSGYIFLGLGFGCCVLLAAYQWSKGTIDRPLLTVVMLLISAIAVLGVMTLLLQPDTAMARVGTFLDDLLFNKMNTDSGQTRSAWNEGAIANIFETFGFGIGVGSSRTSSWLLALVSQTGVVGAVVYAVFIIQLIFPRIRRAEGWPPALNGLYPAFQAYILATIVIVSISWSLVYLGIVFNIVAGLTVTLSRQSWMLKPRWTREIGTLVPGPNSDRGQIRPAFEDRLDC
jgi:hypothetical protein